MDLGEAIKTAMQYESRVYKTYRDAMEEASDDVGRRVFGTLCDEEKEHLRYLGARLEEWQRDGKITLEQLRTAIPDQDEIGEAVDRIRGKASGEPSRKYDKELQLLRKALEVEIETSGFYQRMVRELDAEGQEMFRRFVEIEEGHRAIVQAEIDCVSGSGYWFDTREFDPERG